ncbi:MAG TPA: OprD family outer membrane porin, partial [Azonexus sp.]|nr:OprD family outer membrane porin [Azonexus sp.]
MSKKPVSSITLLPLLSLCGCIIPITAQATGFVDDSHLSLEARNFYMNRDYRDSDKSDVPK